VWREKNRREMFDLNVPVMLLQLSLSIESRRVARRYGGQLPLFQRPVMTIARFVRRLFMAAGPQSFRIEMVDSESSTTPVFGPYCLSIGKPLTTKGPGGHDAGRAARAPAGNPSATASTAEVTSRITST
jgi:hypothetical protein